MKILTAIARTAARLCEAHDAQIYLVEGASMRLVAQHGSVRTTRRLGEPFPVSRGAVHGRAVLTRRVVHVRDLKTAVQKQYPQLASRQRATGTRTVLAVPLLSDGAAVGVIMIRRIRLSPFTSRQIALLKAFADQAAIAIENDRLLKELDTRNRDLARTLEQQTATSDILQVIARSATELSPVFEAVVGRTARLCEAADVAMLLVDRDDLRIAAGVGPLYRSIPSDFSIPLTRGSVATRAVVDCRTFHVDDLLAESDAEYPIGRELALRFGHRSMLAVPLLREGMPIGVICAFRLEVRPFPKQQIALLQTFADQAVVAIENVRLFNELETRNRDLTEALEQQTATSEILRVISASPADLQPVLDAVVKNAARFCGAYDASLFRLAGDHLRCDAHHGPVPQPDGLLLRVVRESVGGRTALEGRTVHVADAQAEAAEFPLSAPNARQLGFRTILSVPLLREGVAIGVIQLRRHEVLPFTDKQVGLLQTFADQAVIAIENVRLFTELQEKNGELTEALEQQTATGEVLHAIAHTPTDAQPVFDTIVRSAARLCHAHTTAVFLTDGQVLTHPANHGGSLEDLAAVRARYPRPVGMDTAPGMAILTRSIVHIEDTEGPAASEHVQQVGRVLGFRSVVTVPMLRGRDAVGAIGVTRREPGGFSDTEVELLKTFADQAVIAVENVRLFKELEARNRDLTEALEQQTATSEILGAISASPTDLQPVLDEVVKSAARFCGADDASIFRLDGDYLRSDAHHGPVPQLIGRLVPVVRGTVGGRTVLERRPIHVADLQAETEEFPEGSATAREVGHRTTLSAPLLREGTAIGVIMLRRSDVHPFTDKQITLLETFADQAVIAIENVRLFTELEARTTALTHSVDQLTALGEVGRAVNSTLDLETVLTTIVARAVQISGMDGGVVFEYDESAEEFTQRAAAETGGVLARARRGVRYRKGEGALGRTAITLEPVQVPDITVPGAYESRMRENLIASGIRAVLAVPMVHQGRLLGCLGVTRNRPGDFPEDTVELLRTFATQSALAIQNARLFHEIADKSRQLETASRHKSEFLANMSHELRTPLNAVIGFSEVLLQRMFGELNDKQDEYLKDIYASGQHLLSLINDILDLSKIEAGRMELAPAPFHLPGALENAVTLVRERAARHGIAMQVELDPRLGEFVGDERKVKQVVLNLLSNAVKFTPEGGRITLTAVRRDRVVEIGVSDTGVGIALEDQATIFEEFRQVGSDERKREGTGLGLALARKFVELHGGRLSVESEAGRGSTFTFTLPAE